MDYSSAHRPPEPTPEQALIHLYPIVHQLVGHPHFHMLSESYCATYCEEKRCLREDPEHFGARFCQLLLRQAMSHPELDKLAMLPEVARMEWLVHDAALSEDKYELNAAQLDTVPPQDHGRICFHAAPSVRLMFTRWPLLRIWHAFHSGNMSTLPGDPDPQWLCIYQNHADSPDQITVEVLEEPVAQLLGAILKGYTLSKIKAMDQNLCMHLPLLVQRNWLDYFTLEDPEKETD